MYRLLSEKRGVGGWVDLDKSVTVRITVAAAMLKLFSVLTKRYIPQFFLSDRMLGAWKVWRDDSHKARCE